MKWGFTLSLINHANIIKIGRCQNPGFSLMNCFQLIRFGAYSVVHDENHCQQL